MGTLITRDLRALASDAMGALFGLAAAAVDVGSDEADIVGDVGTLIEVMGGQPGTEGRVAA